MNNVYGITVILYIKFYVNIIIMSVNNIVFWFGISVGYTGILYNEQCILYLLSTSYIL